MKINTLAHSLILALALGTGNAVARTGAPKTGGGCRPTAK